MVPADTVGTQVALVAAPASTLVQVAVKPVMTWPGLTTAGVVAPKAACMSAATTCTFTLGSQASAAAAAVHAGSPPPERLAVLLPLVALEATFTGMRTMMVPLVAPVLI